MAATFASLLCEDPNFLRNECASQSPPIPFGDWYGKCNRFTCPLVGLAPGTGYILLQAAALDSFDPAQVWPLTFSCNMLDPATNLTGLVSRTLPNVRIVGIPVNVTAGLSGVVGGGTYLVQVADRRIDSVGIACRRYNWRDLPDGDYDDNSKNVGTPWTWTGVITDLWNAVGNLGAFPGLPDTINGTPEQIDAMGVTAAVVLEDLLATNMMAVSYDPLADAFDLIYFGNNPTTDFDGDQADAVPALINDSAPVVFTTPLIPEYVRVQLPVWTYLGAIDPDACFVVDLIYSNGFFSGIGIMTANVISGSFAVMHDWFFCRTNGSGTVQNAADCVTRAKDIAYDFFFRAANAITRFSPFALTYSGVWASDAFIDPMQTDTIIWEDLGDGIQPQDVGRGNKTHVLGSSILGFPTLFAQWPTSNISGAPTPPFLTGSLFSSFQTSKMKAYPATDTTATPGAAAKRAAAAPPSPMRMRQAERIGSPGMPDGPIFSEGAGLGPMIRRGGPLRQWETQIVGMGEIDSVVGRPWRQKNAGLAAFAGNHFVLCHLASATATDPPDIGADEIVTPSNLDWIWVNGSLFVDDGLGKSETIVVKSVDSTGGTFTADFTKDYGGPVTLTGVMNAEGLFPSEEATFDPVAGTWNYQDYVWDRDANGSAPVDGKYYQVELLEGFVAGYPNAEIVLATAAGLQTVTPDAMTDIVVGLQLLVDTVASGVQETVVVTAITGSTFTAFFAHAHGTNTPVVGFLKVYQDALIDLSPAGSEINFVLVNLANTTTTGTITAGSGVTVGVASVTNLYVGASLLIDEFGAASETVTVTAVGGADFTANFANNHASGATVTMTWDALGNVPAVEETFVGDSITPMSGDDCWYSDTNQLRPIDGDFHFVTLTANLVGGKKVYKDSQHPGNQGETFKSVDESSDPSPFSVGPTRLMTLKYADLTENTTDGGAIYTPRDTSATHHGVINIDTAGSVGSAFGGQVIGNGDKKQPANLNATASLGSGFDAINHTGITASLVKWKGVGSPSNTVSCSTSDAAGNPSLDFVAITTGGAANDYGYTGTLNNAIVSINPASPGVFFADGSTGSGSISSNGGVTTVNGAESGGPTSSNIGVGNFSLGLNADPFNFAAIGYGTGLYPNDLRPCYGLQAQFRSGSATNETGKYAYGVFPDDYTMGGIVVESLATRAVGDMYYGDGGYTMVTLPILDPGIDPNYQYQCLIAGGPSGSTLVPIWATNGITLIGENVVTSLGMFDPITMTQPYTTKALSAQAGRITGFA